MYKVALIFVFIAAAGIAVFLFEGFRNGISLSEVQDGQTDVSLADAQDKPEQLKPRHQPPTESDGKDDKVVLTPAIQGSVAQYARLEAAVRPFHWTSVAAPHSGLITEVIAQEGIRVGPGVPLARIESSDFKAELDQHQLAVRARQKEYLEAQIAFQRSARTDDIDLQPAKAAYEQAKGHEEFLKSKLKSYSVRAPVSGTVLRTDISAGDTVTAGQKVFEIGDTSRLRLFAQIEPGHDIMPGDKAYVKMEEAEGGYLSLSVLTLTKARTSEEKDKLYLSLPQLSRLPINAHYDVYVMTASAEGIAAPVTALLRQNGRTYVIKAIIEENRYAFEKIPVETGLEGEDAVIVSSGINVSDMVVVNPDGQTERDESLQKSEISVQAEPYSDFQNFLLTKPEKKQGCGPAQEKTKAAWCPAPEASPFNDL